VQRGNKIILVGGIRKVRNMPQVGKILMENGIILITMDT
jgi:hypothetical protein